LLVLPNVHPSSPLAAPPDLALRQIQDLAEDLVEAFSRERPAICAAEVAEHPLLPLRVDERQSARLLVGLELCHELQPGVDRLDDPPVGVGDLLAQLADQGIVVLLCDVCTLDSDRE